MTTVGNLLTQATIVLQKAGIETARLDTTILLEDCSGKDRAWLLSHDETLLDSKIEQKFKKLLTRRAAHEPLAYIRGKCEFYGREFVLTPAVLQPRPESETLIDLLKEYMRYGLPSIPKSRKVRIADVGTGSGALGITAALELPNCLLELLEIDKRAAKVAKTNVDLFTLNISIIISDLLSASSKDYDVLLCNLPYVPDDYHINLAALHEPRLAIFGGKDGLNIYRKLFKQIKLSPHKPLLILTESLPPQHNFLKIVAEDAGYRQLKSIDFIQVFGSLQYGK